MRLNTTPALWLLVGWLIMACTSAANAQCTVPNLITNGQVTDAAQIMGNFNALLNCIVNPTPSANLQFSGPGGGIVTVQNPGAAANYNFNLPAAAGNAGDLLTSGGGGANPETWTATGASGHALPFLDGTNVWSGTQ